MPGLLEGKKALVAGVATRNSIAWGIARALHAHGAQLAFLCQENNVKRVTRLAARVESDVIVPCDVRSDEDITHAAEHVGIAFGGELHVLVHSIAVANIDDLGGEFIRVTRDGWNLALEVSAYSLVAMARQFRPLLIQGGGGSVMTLTFLGGQRVMPGYNIMGVAKAALDASVRYLAYDLGPDGIRVNAISAGPIRTVSSMVVEGLDVALQSVKEASPLLRPVSIDDMGASAVYLASELAAGVTGQVLSVDSGMSIMTPDARKRRRAESGKE